MKIRLILALLFLSSLAPLGGRAEDAAPERAPEKLSDLYKLIGMNIRRGLSDDVNVWPIRLVGRAGEIIKNGLFYEAEMTLKPFSFQGLSFEKGELLFKKLSVDQAALSRWEIKVLDYRETQTRLIFTLRSLEKKLQSQGRDVKLKADSAERVIQLSGRGRLLLVPMSYESRAGLRWDEKGRKLYLEPKEIRWAGVRFPRWMWWMGASAVPQEPLLDLSASWIPLNIQEIYVGWDRVNLSTNW